MSSNSLEAPGIDKIIYKWQFLKIRLLVYNFFPSSEFSVCLQLDIENTNDEAMSKYVQFS